MDDTLAKRLLAKKARQFDFELTEWARAEGIANANEAVCVLLVVMPYDPRDSGPYAGEALPIAGRQLSLQQQNLGKLVRPAVLTEDEVQTILGLYQNSPHEDMYSLLVRNRNYPTNITSAFYGILNKPLREKSFNGRNLAVVTHLGDAQLWEVE